MPQSSTAPPETDVGLEPDARFVGGIVPEHWLIVRELSAGVAARQARAALREAMQNAGAGEAEIGDAEIIVGELAANADVHACAPYELRIVTVAGRPVWCEVVDGDEDPGAIAAVFDALRRSQGASVVIDWDDEPPQESGRGLSIVHRMCGGRCMAFSTISCTTGTRAKAVGFALPISGVPS